MPKPDVSEQRTAQILEAARKIFTSEPYEAVTMRDIAHTARLSVGGVYWYFQSKEDILAALLERNADANLALMRQTLAVDEPASRRLLLIFEFIAGQVEGQSQLYLMGAKYRAMLSRNPQTHAALDRLGADYRAGLAALIGQGVERGEFAKVDADQAAAAFMGLYEGLMLMWVMSPKTLSLKENLQAAARMMMAGLMCVEHQIDREEA